MKKLNIICVDDQRDVLAAVQKDLAIFDEIADLTECESAPEAEEIVEEMYGEEKPLALLICDHIMPGENGIDFLARLKSDQRFETLHTILLTGLATHTDTIEAINRAHIDHYIEKPWKAENLQQKVRVLLTRYVLENGMDYMDYQQHLDQPTLLREMHKRG